MEQSDADGHEDHHHVSTWKARGVLAVLAFLAPILGRERAMRWAFAVTPRLCKAIVVWTESAK